MPLFTSLSPNMERDDIARAFALVLGRGNVRKSAEEFRKEFAAYHGFEHVYFFNSGRSSLLALLNALGIGKGDEVCVQAFTCNAVPNPVLWSEAVPVYIDVDETLNMSPEDLEKKVTPRAKAVIVQHTFGIPANMDRILEVARRHNLIVIEDCAHALGAEYKGRKVGTMGDVSFFSFGRDKVISSVYGGAAATNNARIGQKIEAFWKTCGTPSRFWVFQQLLHPLIFAIALPLYNVFGIGKVLIKGAQMMKLLSFAVTKGERRGVKPAHFPKRMPDRLAALALGQFRKLERFNAHRRSIAALYATHIHNAHIRTIRNSSRGEGIIARKNVFLRFPVFHEQRDAIVRGARKRGIYLGDWYSSVIAPDGTDLEAMRYKKGSCPNAEEAARTVFNLPTHIAISSSDARKIAEFVNTFV